MNNRKRWLDPGGASKRARPPVRGKAGMLLAGIFCAVLCWGQGGTKAAVQDPTPDLPATGRALYEQACAACHGPQGTGVSTARLGAAAPVPDFGDCDFATREANVDWIAVVQQGGPARAFQQMMPAFGDILTREQIVMVLDHIRTFCRNKEWPRGELNLPRPLVTAKAYPEDEAVLELAYEGENLGRISAELIYEQRFGARNQFEIALPLGWREKRAEAGDTDWESSVGDIALGIKRVLFHSLAGGTIVSAAGEILLPTGNEEEGFGNGTTVFEPYLAVGQILPLDFFLQFQGGFGLPFDQDQANEEAFWRLALGHQHYQGNLGRRWSPMVEILGARELVSAAETDWDVVPQLQVTLSTRQHVRLNIGARVPLNNTEVRETEVLAYLLWDWFDGGFFEGW